MVELDASMTGETKDDNPAVAPSPKADEDGDKGAENTGVGAAGTAVLTREFPAWVLPEAAVLAAGQESGPLPSQWNSDLRKEYSQGCQFLLTLQVCVWYGGGGGVCD